MSRMFRKPRIKVTKLSVEETKIWQYIIDYTGFRYLIRTSYSDQEIKNIVREFKLSLFKLTKLELILKGLDFDI